MNRKENLQIIITNRVVATMIELENQPLKLLDIDKLCHIIQKEYGINEKTAKEAIKKGIEKYKLFKAN